MSSNDTEKDMVLSHLNMRRAAGMLGFSLPFILMIGTLMTEARLRPSISNFYHSCDPVIHGLFVGILCAIGVFLICYKGYEREEDETLSDNQVASATGIGAIGVAIIPAGEKWMTCGYGLCVENLFTLVHYGSAVLFFGSTAFMLYYKFTRTNKNTEKKEITEQKLKRKERCNRIYRCCAVIIIFCLLLLGLLSVFGGDEETSGTGIKQFSPVFWLESFALWAFSLGWIIKGEMLLAEVADKRDD